NYYTILSGYTEKWYHIRLDLNFGTKKWNCYVDQVLKQSNIDFENTQVGSYNKIIYETWGSGDNSQGDTYLDSVGLIGYNGYDQGDNLDTYSCDGTPFVEGTNVIVIPTSLFTRTELHHYIENDQLEQTVLYSDEEGLFEMIANERNGESDGGCADVDYVFIRYDISPDEAMIVLNMVLQGMIEETLDENNNTVYINGTINEYLSSKLDGIRATLLNLPYASLGYIPWVMNYFNSPTGPQPHPADPLGIFIWLITWLIPILHVIIFMIVNMLASDSTGFILNFAKAIFMRLLTALGDLLWLVIRAAILIFAWLIFAITLPFIVIVFLTAVFSLNWILSFKNIDCTITFDSMTLCTEEYTATIGYNCNLIYVNFFDIEIPSINIFYKKDNVVCMSISNNIYNIGLNTINNNDFSTILNSTIISTEQSSSTENLLISYVNGAGATMAFTGSIIAILAAFWTLLNTFKDILLLYLSINLACGSLSFFLYALKSCFLGSDLGIGGMLAGIGTGLLVTAIFSLFIMTCSFSKWNPLSYIALSISTISLILSFIEIFFPDYTLDIEIIQIVLGLFALFCGTFIATSLLGSDSTKKTLLGFAFLSIGFAYGIAFAVFGCILMSLNI
ncbi:MAG: hypothetical protein ACFFBH_12625, partial [Promethearchaeota archaeon]